MFEEQSKKFDWISWANLDASFAFDVVWIDQMRDGISTMRIAIVTPDITFSFVVTRILAYLFPVNASGLTDIKLS